MIQTRSRLPLGAGVREEVSFIETAHGRMYSNRVIPDGARAGVVICSSLHAELLSNYRAEVVLARALGQKRIAVQRFHSIGQGHSDDGPVDLDSLIRDAKIAAKNFQDELGIATMGFMGARLGAFIAASCAVDDKKAPIAMWEPALTGSGYLRNVFRAHATFMMGEAEGEDLDPNPKETLAKAGSAEVLGYRFDKRLSDGISDVDLAERLQDHEGPLLLVQLNKRQNLTKAHTDFSGRFGSRIHTILFQEEPIWWLLKAPVEELDALVDSTSSWLARELGEGQAIV